MSKSSTILTLVFSVEAQGWADETELEAIILKAFGATEAELGLSADYPSEVSLVFTDDETIQGINKQWRGKDIPTNVLSFPAFPLEPGMAPKPLLGDIVIARQTVEREAAYEAKSVDNHLTHLIVHGVLHLFGYDHETEEDAEVMEGLERKILARLAIPDPYALSDSNNV